MSGVPSWARKGVKVVCIKRGAWGLVTGAPKTALDTTHPIFGEAYTIGEVDAEWTPVCLRLREFHDLYNIAEFRPLVSKKTMADDVALIKSHLKAPRSSATKREGADV